MNISLVNAESELGPLCRSYVCAVFDVLKLQIHENGVVHGTQLLWAVGVLSDHKPHYLGAWNVQERKDAWWHTVANDLQGRGVERLRIVVGRDPTEIQAAMAPRYRDNIVLPASATLDHPEVESRLFGHRRYVELALEVTSSLSRCLKREITRHGPFANTAAAAALLRRSTDRRISRDWPEPFEPPPALRSPASVAFKAQAPYGQEAFVASLAGRR